MTRESSGSEQGKVTRRPITVLVAGDFPVLRAGVRCLLDTVDDFEVIAEAGVWEEVCLLCERYSPDVAVIDLTMQGIDGFRILEWVGRKAPRTGAVVLSGQDSP